MKNDKILLLEQLYMAAHVIDTEGRILWANNFEMSQLGYLPADYVGHKFSEVRTESFPKLRSVLTCCTLHNCRIYISKS
jgi:PAS fold